ncbi:hypothetical protein HGA89_01085 [bacterium]|nr:hypothetical protein [bacterium]
MTSECTRLRQLILVEEDLDAVESSEVRRHLRACPACRTLRERVLAVEDAVRSVAALPEAPDPLAALSQIERRQARSSLAVLLFTQGGRPLPRWWRPLPLALAAVVAFAIVLPVLQRGAPVRDLRIGSPLVLRGEASAPAAEAHGVSFRLTKSGYPVLIHVDGAGAVRLLYPAFGAPPTRLGKDRLALLPPGGADAWRADLAPGTETYLLAVATREPPNPRSLQSLLGVSTRSREQTIRDVAERLCAYVGEVSRLDDPSAD